MKKEKGFIHVVLETFIGLIIFFALLWISQWLSDLFGYESFIQLVSFFRNRLAFIIAISLIMFIADLFYILLLPLKFFSGGFRAIGSAMIVWFVIDLFSLIDSFLGTNIYGLLSGFQFLIAIIVFLIVLVFSVLHMVHKFDEKKEDIEKSKKDEKNDKNDFESLKEEVKRIPETVKKNISEALSKKEEKVTDDKEEVKKKDVKKRAKKGK